jgi:hypothetical protein
MVHVQTGLILEQKFGIRWLGGGFPDWWRFALPLEPLPVFIPPASNIP